jgi:GWxTD domain-containing protein
MKRVHRLLYPRGNPRTFLAPAISAGMLTIVAALALTAWQSNSAYYNWVNEDVRYIITDAERIAFQQLQTNEEREMFVEQFWERRGPSSREKHYQRIAYANHYFSSPSGVPGWKTDRGRIYITFGPPDEIDSHVADNNPYEDWRYRHLENIADNVKIEFAGPELHMTMDPNPWR